MTAGAFLLSAYFPLPVECVEGYLEDVVRPEQGIPRHRFHQNLPGIGIETAHAQVKGVAGKTMRTAVASVGGAPSTGNTWVKLVISVALRQQGSSNRPSSLGGVSTKVATATGRVGGGGAFSPAWMLPQKPAIPINPMIHVTLMLIATNAQSLQFKPRFCDKSVMIRESSRNRGWRREEMKRFPPFDV